MSWSGVLCLLTYFVIAPNVKCNAMCGTDDRTYLDEVTLAAARSVNPELDLLYAGPCLRAVNNRKCNDLANNDLRCGNRKINQALTDLTLTNGRTRLMGGERRQLRENSPYPLEYPPSVMQYPLTYSNTPPPYVNPPSYPTYLQYQPPIRRIPVPGVSAKEGAGYESIY